MYKSKKTNTGYRANTYGNRTNSKKSKSGRTSGFKKKNNGSASYAYRTNSKKSTTGRNTGSKKKPVGSAKGTPSKKSATRGSTTTPTKKTSRPSRSGPSGTGPSGTGPGGSGPGGSATAAIATPPTTSSCSKSCSDTYFSYHDYFCPKINRETPEEKKLKYECYTDFENKSRHGRGSKEYDDYEANFNIYEKDDNQEWKKKNAPRYNEYLNKWSKNKLCQLLRKRSMMPNLPILKKGDNFNAWKGRHKYQVEQAKERAKKCQYQLISLGKLPVERTLASKTDISNDMIKNLKGMADTRGIKLSGTGKTITSAIYEDSLVNCNDDCLGDGGRRTIYNRSIANNNNVKTNRTYEKKKEYLMSLEPSRAWNISKPNNRRNSPKWSNNRKKWAKNALKSWPK